MAGLLTLALETRRWLKSAKREKIDVRPMGHLQNPESQKRYARYWKQFICYCLWIVAAEKEEDGTAELFSSEDDDDSNAGDDNTCSQTTESEDASQADGEDDDEDEGDGSDNMKFLRDARSMFRWQREQKRLAEKPWHSLQMAEAEDEKVLTDQVLQLSASFIFQTLGTTRLTADLYTFLLC